MKVDNYYLTAQYTYPISQLWAIYLNLGVNRYDIEFDDVRYTDIIAPSVDGVGVDFAAGLGLNFITKRFMAQTIGLCFCIMTAKTAKPQAVCWYITKPEEA